MLHRSDACPHRSFGPFGGMGVDSNERVVPGSLLDGRSQFGLGEFRGAGDATAGQHRPGPDALDDVCATDQEAADPLAHLVRRSDDTEPEVLGQRDVPSQSDDIPAAPWRGDEGACAAHPRPDDVAPVDRVAQGAVGERPERPEVADGREAGLDRLPSMTDADQDFLRGRGRRRGDECCLDVTDEVGVRIDQAGHHAQSRQVDDGDPVRDPVRTATDARDPTGVVDVDDPVDGSASGLDIDAGGRSGSRPRSLAHPLSLRVEQRLGLEPGRPAPPDDLDLEARARQGHRAWRAPSARTPARSIP